MKTYRTGKPLHLAALLLALAAILVLGIGALRARTLMRSALDGRREREQQTAYLREIGLRAEMNSGQADTRVNGWLSIVQEEDVTLNGARGVLHARLYPAVGQADAPWAIVLHGGLGTDSRQVRDLACMLSLSGYRVLTPDLYAHGKSGGEMTSLGLRDAQDVHGWIDWILMEDADARIVLLGLDEGGVAALLAACDGLPEAVKAVAADSAYSSVRLRAQQLAAEIGFAQPLDAALLEAAFRAVHGVSLAEGELTQRIARADVPLLLIHATGDEDVPAWHSEDLTQAAGENAQLLYIEGAPHGMGRFAQRELYEETLLDFFAAALDAQ